jgi:hypothetical protein
MLHFRHPVVMQLLALFLALSTVVFPQQDRQPMDSGKVDSAPMLEAANVNFRYTPQLSVLIHAMRGRLVPASGHDVPDFNHPDSFVIATDAAEISMTTAQLAAMMNDYMLSDPDAQIKNVSLKVEGDKLHIHGTMKKGIHVPFDALATPSLTDDNRIRFAVSEMKGAKIPMKGIMDKFGGLEKMISSKGLKGLSVEKDTLLVDPQTALPPPQLRAKISAVHLRGDALVMVVGSGAPKLDNKRTKNYMAVRGGNIRYGRDEMFDSDLMMIDTTPADPFDFFLREYKTQFNAGYVKTTPDMALRSYIPDYGKLHKGKK